MLRYALVLPLLLCFAVEATAQTRTVQTLTLEASRQAAAAAGAEARANGWNVAIAVVDAGGELLYFERLEGTQLASIDIAIGKARTAVRFRRSTKAFEDGIAGGRAALLSLDILPFEGGLPIVVDGEIVGAIGVSGVTPAQDGQIARAGVQAIAPDAPRD
jgi:glc operon protein GlcG